MSEASIQAARGSIKGGAEGCMGREGSKAGTVVRQGGE